MLGLSGVASPSFETTPGPTRTHLVSINSGVVERDSLGITKDDPITQEIPRVFEAVSGKGGKPNMYFCSITLRNDNIK